MTHMRPRLSVSLACLTAVLALSACGTPGSSGGSVSQTGGAASTGFDTSKQVTLTMWDTENASGPSKAEDELIQQFELLPFINESGSIDESSREIRFEQGAAHESLHSIEARLKHNPRASPSRDWTVS